jgi:hypothetical protein
LDDIIYVSCCTRVREFKKKCSTGRMTIN